MREYTGADASANTINRKGRIILDSIYSHTACQLLVDLGKGSTAPVKNEANVPIEEVPHAQSSLGDRQSRILPVP